MFFPIYLQHRHLSLGIRFCLKIGLKIGRKCSVNLSAVIRLS